MSDTQLLLGCVNQTLETMFYTSVEEVADPRLETPRIGWTSFRGTLDGRLAVGLDEAAADTLAASFLGLDPDEIVDRDREQVVGELANIVCGSYLSAWQPEGRFALSSPETVDTERIEQERWEERICFRMPEGLFRIWLAIEREAK